MSLPLVRYAFDIFPSLHSLQSDVRIFAFWVALLVAGLTIVKNAMSALAGMRTAMLGEAVAPVPETLFRYFLNSSYLDFLSGKTRQIPQVFSWRSQLQFFLVNLMQVYTYIVISHRAVSDTHLGNARSYPAGNAGCRHVAMLFYLQKNQTKRRCRRQGVRRVLQYGIPSAGKRQTRHDGSAYLPTAAVFF